MWAVKTVYNDFKSTAYCGCIHLSKNVITESYKQNWHIFIYTSINYLTIIIALGI